MKWNNLKVGTKITVCVAFFICILAASAVISIRGIQDLLGKATDASSLHELSSRFLQREVDHLKWVQALSLFVHDPKASALTAQTDPTQCAFGKWYYSQARSDIERRIPALAAPLREIEDPHSRLHATAKRIAELRAAGDLAGAEKTFRGESLAQLEKVQTLLTAMRQTVQGDVEGIEKDMTREGARIESTVTVFGAVAVLVGVALAALITLSIVRPISAGVVLARAVADGDLNHPAPKPRGDEIGVFIASLTGIATALHGLTTEYDDLVRAIESGDLLRRGDPGRFQGSFADLITGANTLADVFVTHIDNIPTPVLTMDRDFAVLFMNRTGRALFPGRETHGQNAFELLHPADCRTRDCAVATALREGRLAQADTEAQPGDRRMDIRYFATPIVSREGGVTGALEVIMDQTDIVAARRKMLEAATEADQVASGVADAARELSTRVEQAGRGSELQAVRLGETATAMEEMNATVLEVAKNASQAAESSDAARQKAKAGEDMVTHLVRGIDEVRAQSMDLLQNMNSLGEKAQGIGRIIGVINDIADQTNLLALNAAIEAARAGEAGRGFAVVADEVRKLAEKTMVATREVGEAIESVQAGARDNAARVDGTVRAVKRVTELADQSGQALREIVDLVDAASDQVRSIATASEEQSAASEEINRAVDEINRVSAETAQGMSDSVRTVMSLTEQSDILTELIHSLRGGGKTALPS
ncbi:methyl-accepting chemotaxis protein [Desulfolutivibrio sp.]|uniref:methyl-accepting chemotaxis protein n=1 Tax=Desulfolutivibrio sp. TaxID=2773296 RepID=UPI002F963E6A